MGSFLRSGLAAIAAVALVPAGASAAMSTIQPGDYLDLGCTLGWVFDDDAGRTYFSTAAHCVEAVGEEVRVAEDTSQRSSERLGQVRLKGDADTAEGDLALVEVHPTVRAKVRGEMRGHPTIPSGAATPDELAAGTRLQMSGWGGGFERDPFTRESRQGVLLGGSPGAWDGVAPASGGDSGGPVAELSGDRAMGLVKGHRIGSNGHGSWGPTVWSVIQHGKAAGLTLRLRLAGEEPPAIAAPAPAPPATQPKSQPAAARDSRRARVARKRAACRRRAGKVRSAKKRRAALRRCARIRR